MRCAWSGCAHAESERDTRDGEAEEEMQAVCHKEERKHGLWQGEGDLGAGGSC